MSATVTKEMLDELMADHHQNRHGWCYTCGGEWPCTTAMLIGQYCALTAERDNLREYIWLIKDAFDENDRLPQTIFGALTYIDELDAALKGSTP